MKKRVILSVSLLLFLLIVYMMVKVTQPKYKTCTLYLNVERTNTDEQGVILLSANGDKLHQYAGIYNNIATFQLSEDEINQVTDFEFVLDACTDGIIIYGFSISDCDGQLNYYPLDILDKFVLNDEIKSEIRSEGGLYITTDKGEMINIEASGVMCEELNQFRLEP